MADLKHARMAWVHACDETRSCSNDTANITDAPSKTVNPLYVNYMSYLALLSALPTDMIILVTSAVYIMGVLANWCLIVYLIKFKRYKSPLFVVILSLAFCDMGVCLSSLFWAHFALYKLLGPLWLCFLFGYSVTFFLFSSIHHIVFFSILRFYQLVFPLKARGNITVSLVVKICACLWIVNALISIGIPSHYFGASFPQDDKLVHFCTWKANDYQVFLVFSYLVIPNVLIVVFQLVKHVLVLRQSKSSVSESESSTDKRQSTDARAVAIVILVFCITSWPEMVQVLCHQIFCVPPASYHIILNAIAVTMQHISSAVNPWIYVFGAQSIRKDVIAMLCSCFRRKQGQT